MPTMRTSTPRYVVLCLLTATSLLLFTTLTGVWVILSTSSSSASIRSYLVPLSEYLTAPLNTALGNLDYYTDEYHYGVADNNPQRLYVFTGAWIACNAVCYLLVVGRIVVEMLRVRTVEQRARRADEEYAGGLEEKKGYAGRLEDKKERKQDMRDFLCSGKVRPLEETLEHAGEGCWR